MTYSEETTQELAKLVRLLIQLREIRDFTKAEIKQAEEEDTYLWMDTNHTIIDSIRMTEVMIGSLLPSGKYHYRRSLPKP